MKMAVLLSSVLACATSLSMAQVRISYDMSTHQNKRSYQEDRFTHAMVQGCDFFGVYDGHLGGQTSLYLQQQLHNFFADDLSKGAVGEFSIKTGLESAFAKVEDYALKHFTAGSTAVVVYIDKDNQLHCAWAGDSRAVLESNGAVSFVTQDHKPRNIGERNRLEKERNRIKESGEPILVYDVWRLEVSRSIGNRELKNVGQGQIIAVPEYVQIQLNKNNHFMIMASDGLWDVISNEDAVRIVQEHLKKSRTLKGVAQQLQNEAMKRGSGDNITVCVIKFDWADNNVQEKPLSLMTRLWNWTWGARASDK